MGNVTTIPSTLSISVLPPVIERDGMILADSRDVASYFGKNHRHILRDVENLVGSPTLNDPENVLLLDMFIRREEYRSATNRGVPFYEMTKNGFMLLTMGFTGTTALGFKVAYIRRFDELEAALHSAVETAQTALKTAFVSLHGRLADIERKLATWTHTPEPAFTMSEIAASFDVSLARAISETRHLKIPEHGRFDGKGWRWNARGKDACQNHLRRLRQSRSNDADLILIDSKSLRD
jgi:Rha family phage regulatory protein